MIRDPLRQLHGKGLRRKFSDPVLHPAGELTVVALADPEEHIVAQNVERVDILAVEVFLKSVPTALTNLVGGGLRRYHGLPGCFRQASAKVVFGFLVNARELSFRW